MSARVSEMTNLIPITRAHGVENDELARMDITLDHVRHEGVRLDVLNGRFGVVAWVMFQLLSAACLVTAAWAARTGALDLTAGDVVLLSLDVQVGETVAFVGRQRTHLPRWVDL